MNLPPLCNSKPWSDINNIYTNYINYNPKLLKETEVDKLAVADTGTIGYYLTLDSPCDNNIIAFILLPIRMTNKEIITSTHTVLLYKLVLPIETRKAHIFTGLNKDLLSIETKLRSRMPISIR